MPDELRGGIVSPFLLQERGTINNSSFSFSANCRLKKKKDFAGLQAQANKFYSKHFLILIASSPTSNSRLGITITTKVDKRAVGRNRLKRRIREVFRLTRRRLVKNFDILVIARQNASFCPYDQVKREILGILHHNSFLTIQ